MHVTVLLSIYNQADSLGGALESLIAQTYTNWDLLVVDDASMDRTPELLREYVRRDARISVLRNPNNLGLAASLNRGWRQARGELVARLDADDACLPNRLEEQVRFLESHPEVSVLGSAAELVDEAGRHRRVVRRPETHEALVARMYRENPFFHSSVMMRREFLEAAGGYDDRLRRAQDLDLWLRSYRRFRFHNLSAPLIRYHLRPRLSGEAILAGTRVLLRSGYREGKWLTAGWYSLRFLTAAILGRMGLWRPFQT